MKALVALVGGSVIASVGLPVVALTMIIGFAGGGVAGAGVQAAPTGGTGIPAGALVAYQAAAQACPGLSWAVLAGIGEVESDHGRSVLPGVASGTNAAGAEGPMQFEEATFRAYADPGASPYDLRDAALAAARLLCADGGADPDRLVPALWDYNHSQAYVDEVLAWAGRYGIAGPATGRAAAAWAVSQVGIPYAWGAAGPDAYDCSGLVLRAYQSVGIDLPRVAADQFRAGRSLPYADAMAGDLVFFAPDPADPATIDHVGIYLGNNLMVEAPHPGANVRVVPVYPEGLVAAVTRPWAP